MRKTENHDCERSNAASFVPTPPQTQDAAESFFQKSQSFHGSTPALLNLFAAISFCFWRETTSRIHAFRCCHRALEKAPTATALPWYLIRFCMIRFSLDASVVREGKSAA